MSDFLLQMIVVYPWFSWLLAFLAAVGLGYGATWVAGGIVFASSWMGWRRARWNARGAALRRLNSAPCAVCQLAEEEILAMDDPPEYQHPDEDEDDLEWWAALADALADMAEDQPPARPGPPLCRDPGCEFYGWIHQPPCKPAAGPAMPPVPWSGQAASLPLHPAIVSDLEAAGFGGHDYTEDIAASAFTAAEAAEVQAMVTDGTIPVGLLDKGQDDG